MQFAEQNHPVLDRFRHLVGQRDTSYTGCEIKLAVQQLRSGGWGLYVGRMIFSDTKASEDRVLDYGAFKLLQAFIPVQEALKTVETAALSGHLYTHGLQIAITGYLQDDQTYWGYQQPGYWPSDGSAFGLRWPAKMFQLVQNPAPQLVHPVGPLVTKELPLYPDVSSLLKHQIGHEVQGTVFTHNLVVLVPNYQARITDVQVGMHSISIQTETHPSAKEGPVLKIFAMAGEMVQKESSLSSGQQTYEVPLQTRPDSWEVALLGHDGEFLDSRSPYMASVQSHTRSFTILDVEAIRQLALEGESETVEFKMAPHNDAGREDLVETVVAFSNTAGGVILVGVNDNGQIEGAGAVAERDSLLSMIRDRTAPPLAPTVRQVTVDDKPLYVIEVSPGEDKPYLLAGKGIAYVRVGSTDRPPTRYELLEMLRRPRGLA